MEVVGEVVRVEVEGGFLGIIGDDGRRYAINDDALAAAFVGRRVRAEVERVGGVSIRMWGREVNIHAIAGLDAITGPSKG